MSRKQELLAKVIIIKEFCDYMTIINFLKGAEYCKVYYEVYWECVKILQQNGVSY